MTAPKATEKAVWLIPDEARKEHDFLGKLPAELSKSIEPVGFEDALKRIAKKIRPKLIFVAGRPDKTAQSILSKIENAAPEIPVFVISHWETASAMQSWVSQNFVAFVQPESSRILEQPNTYRLSDRELHILRLMVRGLIKKEIAEELRISYHTVDNHERNIFKKLNIHTRSAAVAKALIEKIV